MLESVVSFILFERVFSWSHNYFFVLYELCKSQGDKISLSCCVVEKKGKNEMQKITLHFFAFFCIRSHLRTHTMKNNAIDDVHTHASEQCNR